METYSHVVVKKMRRAGIVGLFAAGLAFAGVAPANAISGGELSNPGFGSKWSGGGLIASPCPRSFHLGVSELYRRADEAR